ncbi:hypothetical protein ES703_89401 [subsurface metagenome]
MAVEEQTDGTLWQWVYDANSGRFGQKLTISNREVSKLAHYISKTGNPAGDITLTIRKVSNDAVLLTKVWGDATGVVAGGGWVEVTFDTPLVIDEEVRILFEYSAGDGSNMLAGWAVNDVKGGEISTRYLGGVYSDSAAKDAKYIYTYEEPSVAVPMSSPAAALIGAGVV